jgi:hypothetical protein
LTPTLGGKLALPDGREETTAPSIAWPATGRVPRKRIFTGRQIAWRTISLRSDPMRDALPRLANLRR